MSFIVIAVVRLPEFKLKAKKTPHLSPSERAAVMGLEDQQRANGCTDTVGA